MNKEQQPNSGSNNQDPGMSRRRLITYLLGFSVVATLGGVLTPIAGYLWPPSRASARSFTSSSLSASISGRTCG